MCVCKTTHPVAIPLSTPNSGTKIVNTRQTYVYTTPGTSQSTVLTFKWNGNFFPYKYKTRQNTKQLSKLFNQFSETHRIYF